MNIIKEQIPLSLYVHIPWCIRKCPYCDFNSHAVTGSLPEKEYVAALLADLDHHLPLIAGRKIVSLFFGGGTPSLLSGQSIHEIIQGIQSRLTLHPQIEITLEANPGTIDQSRFDAFYQAGINRLSMGIQSFQHEKLKTLGRIHDATQAMAAITSAKKAGFSNFNLDLMFGLPQQTKEDALYDLQTALSFSPTHLSWYQLTIEPNTLFNRYPPSLPVDDDIWDMQVLGHDYLQQAGYQQYEVSAFALPQKECMHNRHYWEFGDYLGIGAGAHSKITNIKENSITRIAQVRQPKDYLNAEKRQQRKITIVHPQDRIVEFMLNALRLSHGIALTLFEERTGLTIDSITPLLTQAENAGLLWRDGIHMGPTTHGKKFLNDLIALFLP